MPAVASRLVLRQSRLLVRRSAFRQNSTTSEAGSKAQDAASKAKDAAASTAAKASEGLSKVKSAAGPALAGAVGALKRIGGRTGRVVSFVESLIPPTIYYSRVAFEVSKIVFRSQKMAPPNLATMQAYWQPILATLRQPSTWSSKLNIQPYISRIRNMDRKQLAVVGVTAAEVIGFFSVGEMLGRMKIVGYRGEPAHEH